MDNQIIKIGSDVTVNDLGNVNIELIRGLGNQMIELEQQQGIVSHLVFSGYVKAGKILLKDKRKTSKISFNELEEIVIKGRSHVLQGLQEALKDLFVVEERLFTYDDLYRDEEHHNQLREVI